MNWRIPLSEPEIDNDEIQAVVDVLKSKWLTMGDVTRRFEEAFAGKLGVKHAFAVSNCTAALHLANLALGIGPGDEVICPDLTFVASANASRYTGADVVLADSVSNHDLTISPVDIEQLITPRTKAITVVHYGGFACHMDEILSIADRHGLVVIEDCAHAPFAQYQSHTGKISYLGTLGAVGCFSFFSNKNMCTGEGGMVVTNDDDLAEKIKLLRSHGMTTLTLERHRGHASTYDVTALGYNYRIDEMRSAIGLVQLGKIDRFNQDRRILWNTYVKLLKDVLEITVPFTDRLSALSTPHIMSVISADFQQQIIEELKNKCIQTSKHYTPISSFKLYENVLSRLTISHEKLITLPLYPSMNSAMVEEICQIIRCVIKV